jgi:hypothetical protein
VKFQKKDDAITQIMGTILLLLIALAALSMIYMYILSYPHPVPVPLSEIVGRIEEGNIILLHNGGDALELNTQLLINISNTTYVTSVGDHLDSKSKKNGAWDISEQVIYTPTVDITNLHVDTTVIDKESSTVIMTAVLQE